MSEKKIILPKEQSLLAKNRTIIAEELGMPERLLSDRTVEKLAGWYPEPLLWKNRIRVVIPLAEIGFSRFWQYLMRMQHIGWHVDNGKIATVAGQYIADAHNSTIRDALEKDDWDYLVFLEHDHIFPSDLLSRIGQDYTQPIVGALYYNRILEDPEPVAYMWDETRTSIRRLQPFEMAGMLDKPGFYEVDVVPMGCTAIRRDVLENWPKGIPYFAAPTSPHNGRTMSDDVWFCRYAQELGWKIWLDTLARPSHFAIMDVNSSVYVAWVAKQQELGNAKPKAEVEMLWEDVAQV